MRLLRYVFIASVFFGYGYLQSTELTYTFSGGRFGDNLIAYVHAKWVAYKYGLKLLYKPFAYSDQLVLHKEEAYFDKNKHYDNIIKLTDKIKINTAIAANWLYIVPYYPECIAELNQFKRAYPFCCAVDWNDPVFLANVRYLISPIKQLQLLSLPTDRRCVALHVRKGGGYDAKPLLDGGVFRTTKGATAADVSYPLKFPPDDFYIEQLKNVSTFFNNAPLYVYIFTDDQDPKRLADKYSSELKLPNITFDYRKTGNAHNTNVLEDFFSMMKFDVLIRSESSFSLVASRLAPEQLVIYPLTASYQSNEQWSHGLLKITQFCVVKNKG